MRQDKERSIREQADLWKGYWCILACILLVGRVSYLTFFQNHIVSVYAAAQTEQKEDSSVQILQENLMEEIQIDVGAKEEEEGKVSVRSRYLGDEGMKDLGEFLTSIKEEIKNKTIRKIEVQEENK